MPNGAVLRGRGNTERIEIVRGRALNVGGVTRLYDNIPLGEGWHKAILRFNHVVTIGTGTGPLSEGGLRVVRGITIKSDRGDVFVDKVPARALYRFAQYKTRGAGALLDAILAANGTYRALVVVNFVDPLAAVPIDTILDTSRYQQGGLGFEIDYGGVADLYSSPGTATVAPTVDIYVERTRGPLPKNVRPSLGIYYGVRPDRDPAVETQIDLERATNLLYKRLLLFGANTTTVAGVPFSGDAANILNDFTLDHDKGKPFENFLYDVMRELNKDDGAFESPLTGAAFLDLVRDGSIHSSLISGNKSRLRVQWTNGTLGATPRVSVAYEGMKPLR